MCISAISRNACHKMNLQSNTATSHCILSNSFSSITGEGLVVGQVQGKYDQALTQYFSFQ